MSICVIIYISKSFLLPSNFRKGEQHDEASVFSCFGLAFILGNQIFLLAGCATESKEIPIPKTKANAYMYDDNITAPEPAKILWSCIIGIILGIILILIIINWLTDGAIGEFFSDISSSSGGSSGGSFGRGGASR